MTTLDDYFTVQEAMDELNVSKQTIYSMAERYGWSSRKIGPARLYLRADVLATPRTWNERLSQGQQRRQSARKGISTEKPVPTEKPKPAPRKRKTRAAKS
jgi:hypothetical protein